MEMTINFEIQAEIKRLEFIKILITKSGQMDLITARRFLKVSSDNLLAIHNRLMDERGKA